MRPVYGFYQRIGAESQVSAAGTKLVMQGLWLERVLVLALMRLLSVGAPIGRYALIGAGAVVTKNVPDYAVMVGVPARRIGWVCECGTMLENVLKCVNCGKRYIVTDTGLALEG